jgi:CheY-like chemotaxis protein
MVRLTTCDMLEELGYQTIDVGSAGEAEALLVSGEAVDLVVTEHLMPDMTGAQLARKIKAQWPRLPVLLVSGFAEAEAVAADIPRLTKPFRQLELGEAIAALN